MVDISGFDVILDMDCDLRRVIIPDMVLEL